ncbi:RNA polymerase sigma factor [Candidatus Daviesbacteria bacterium]|nr:RNA polymerase sigma factor [Candidatus Daviesbacteria bacterium]
MSDDLEQVIKKAKGGDKDAFGKLYEQFRKRIFRYIYYLTYDRDLGEDLTQLTFLKAWVALPKFSSQKGTLQAYLYSIARNLVIDYKRRRKEVSLENIAEPAYTTNFEDNLIREENVKMVQTLLAGLDGEEKQLVIFRYFEELHFGEIAHILHKKEGAIRVRLHRILQKLKERVKDKYGY